MRTGKKILFAILALLALLVGLELASRLIEYVRAVYFPGESEEPDAYAVADAYSPLAFQQLKDRYLVPMTIGGQEFYQTQGVDRPGQFFERKKPAGQVRIVILGESQAGAMGLSDHASYARYLERFLRTRHPEKDIRVINLACTGYAGAQLAVLAQRTLPAVKPDLVLAIFGHNERLDVKAYAKEGRIPPEALALSRRLRGGSALVRLLAPRPRGQSMEISTDGEPLPRLVNDIRWQHFWLARLERSVGRMAAVCRETGAGLVLFNPPSNLSYVDVRDWWWIEKSGMDQRLIQARHWLLYGAPERALVLLRASAPEKPGPAMDLLIGQACRQAGREEEARELFQRVVHGLESAGNLSREEYLWILVQARVALGEIESARALVREQQKLDRQFGGRLAVIGLAVREVGLKEEAQETLRQARDEDDLAIRAPSIFRRAQELLAKRWKTRFYDLDQALAKTCPDGITGWDLFIDYCHLTPRGHVRVAGLLLEVVEKSLRLPSERENPAAATESELLTALSGREQDFAEIDRWLGVCHDIWQLSDENAADLTCRMPPPAEDPISLCYNGNLVLELAHGDDFVRRAAEWYQRSLAADPDFAPAQRNLQILHERYPARLAP